jgi:hypothetical protein
MKAHLESQIDELYKLPLDEFTKARNTLAKTLSDGEKKSVTALVKPSLPMWVVNLFYWDNPSTYKALVDASEKLRTAHRSALTGRHVDTHKPDELHKATLEKAFAQAVAAAQKKGIRLTDASRDAVRRTLAALPTDEPAGRITREPPAAGFSLLTGIKPQGGLTPSDSKGVRPQPTTKPSAAELKRQKQAEKQAEQIRKAAERSTRLAEEKAKKEREKREREIAKAEQALRDAERRLAELKR